MKNVRPPKRFNMSETVFSRLPEFLQRALSAQGFVSPTPVQTASIGAALDGRDLLVTAQTGTGKTLAFLLPLAARLWVRPEGNALILSPTRELAQQTFEIWQHLTEGQNLPAALVIGGDNIHKQFADLRRKPRVIVATPGRVKDHLLRKSIDLRRTHTLVLDETDRMLDMGFIEDIRQIMAALPQPRLTWLFSATLPGEVEQLARDLLRSPLRVKIGSVVSAAERVVQQVVRLDIREKLPQLLHELKTRDGSVLVFVRTKHGAQRLAQQLKMYGQKANALHGDLSQNRRRQVLAFFKNQTVRTLVATDVAARGIDVAHIAHVINYDLPQSPQDYIHRIGRTGRAGAVGNAISFIAGDEEKWNEICKVTRFTLPVSTVQKTIEPLPVPKFIAREEGLAHSRNRRPKKQPLLPPEIISTGRVLADLPGEKKQGKAETERPNKRPRVSETALPPKQQAPFRIVRVGASKKTLQQSRQLRTRSQAPKRVNKKFRHSRRSHR